MKNIWTVLCQGSAVDVDSNSISIFNSVDELQLDIDTDKASQIAQGIILPITLQLVSLWLVESQDKVSSFSIKVDLLDPSDKVLNSFINNFSFKENLARYRTRINMQGLKISAEGRYSYRISQKIGNMKEYEVASSLPFDVKISYRTAIQKEPKKNND